MYLFHSIYHLVFLKFINSAIYISVCENKADVVFVLDASGSIGEANFNTIKTFVAGLAQDLDVDSGRVRVSLITFSNDVEARFQVSINITLKSTVVCS